MQRASQQPVGVCLRQALPQTQVFGGDGIFAESCTTDADLVRPGDVFFAVDADDPLGAANASAAAQKGAKAIVTDQYLPIFTTPQYVVPNAADAYSRFCHKLVGNPSEELTLSVVAGAHGKSTVARLLTGILRTADQRCGCLADGLRSDHTSNDRRDNVKQTTASVARWMSDCVVHGCRHAVMELSQQAAIEHRLSGAKAGLLCLTNLSYDRSTGRPPATERQLIQQMVDDLAPFALLVANSDDPDVVQLAAVRNGLTVTYGFDKPADVSGVLIASGASGQMLMVTAGDETVAIDLPYVGPGLAQDALAAIASATALGIRLTDAARAAETVIRLPGVMQSLACGQPFPLFIDQGNSPERLRAALNGVRTAASGRVLVVLPEDASPAMNSVAHALGDLVFAPQGAATEGPDEGATRYVEDRFAGLALAVALAEADDAVLIAGAARLETERETEESAIRQLVALRLSNTKEPAAMP